MKKILGACFFLIFCSSSPNAGVLDWIINKPANNKNDNIERSVTNKQKPETKPSYFSCLKESLKDAKTDYAAKLLREVCEMQNEVNIYVVFKSLATPMSADEMFGVDRSNNTTKSPIPPMSADEMFGVAIDDNIQIKPKDNVIFTKQPPLTLGEGFGYLSGCENFSFNAKPDLNLHTGTRSPNTSLGVNFFNRSNNLCIITAFSVSIDNCGSFCEFRVRIGPGDQDKVICNVQEDISKKKINPVICSVAGIILE
jgi:hypothetical protein